MKANEKHSSREKYFGRLCFLVFGSHFPCSVFLKVCARLVRSVLFRFSVVFPRVLKTKCNFESRFHRKEFKFSHSSNHGQACCDRPRACVLPVRDVLFQSYRSTSTNFPGNSGNSPNRYLVVHSPSVCVQIHRDKPEEGAWKWWSRWRWWMLSTLDLAHRL